MYTLADQLLKMANEAYDSYRECQRKKMTRGACIQLGRRNGLIEAMKAVGAEPKYNPDTGYYELAN